MTDLAALIPPHDPAEDALATVGGMALDAIPLVGSIAARALDHALATRERMRRHEFDIAIVERLQRIAEKLDGSLTIEEVANSDEFLATLARAQREAAETASASKRQRLAHAAVSVLDPDAPSRAEREDYFRLITELDDLHVWLMAFYANPRAWLDAHGVSLPTGIMGGGTSDPLKAALAHVGETFSPPVEAALDELRRQGLADVPRNTLMTHNGMLESRLSARGHTFLQYLNEDSPSDTTPPGL